MTGRPHAPHQTTANDPGRAVAVLEAHLGRPLATWQAYAVIALLTPRHLWANVDAATLVAPVAENRAHCPVCAEVRHVRLDGRMRMHRGFTGGFCTGSSKPPADDAV